MKTRRIIFFFSLFILIGTTALFSQAAAIEWIELEGDSIVYNITGVSEDEVVVKGTFTITIEAKPTTSTLTYNISATLETDEKGYTANLTVPSTTTTSDELIVSLLDVDSLTLIFSTENFEVYKTGLEELVEEMSDSDRENHSGSGVTIRYQKLNHGWERKFEDTTTDQNEYFKIQYDRYGILTNYESSSLNLEGKETGIKITQKTLNLTNKVKGIPGFDTMLIGLLSIASLGVLLKFHLRRKN